jgi:hypothetical protein
MLHINALVSCLFLGGRLNQNFIEIGLNVLLGHCIDLLMSLSLGVSLQGGSLNIYYVLHAMARAKYCEVSFFHVFLAFECSCHRSRTSKSTGRGVDTSRFLKGIRNNGTSSKRHPGRKFIHGREKCLKGLT